MDGVMVLLSPQLTTKPWSRRINSTGRGSQFDCSRLLDGVVGAYIEFTYVHISSSLMSSCAFPPSFLVLPNPSWCTINNLKNTQ